MRLSGREKVTLGLGAGACVCLGFWLWVYEPVNAYIELLNHKVEAKRSEYREIQELADRYKRLSENAKEVEARLNRGKGFSIPSYLESLAVEVKLKKTPQIRAKGGETTRHYRENAVEVKIEKILLPDLVKFLFLIENPKEGENAPDLLRVKQLRIHPTPENKNLLDVTFQVSGYEPLEKG